MVCAIILVITIRYEAVGTVYNLVSGAKQRRGSAVAGFVAVPGFGGVDLPTRV